MALKHQNHGRQIQAKVGGDADVCNAHYSLSFSSRGTNTRRTFQRTSSKLTDGKSDNLTLTAHLRQERPDKLKVQNLKGGNRGDFRGKQQEDRQAANCRPFLLPPIKPQGAPVQCTPSASPHPINKLGNQVMDLQLQPDVSTTEIQLITCPEGCREVVLQQLKDWANKQPQVLIQHNHTVHTLQELLQQAWARISALVRQLNASKARLQSICCALWKLQQLSQDHSLDEREELAQRVKTLTLELDLKNKRIQDLEKNLELTNASFSRQLSSQLQKTQQARELSKSLQEEINYLKQKIHEQMQLLKIRNIYSYRFSEQPPGKAAKESKSVQTEQLCPVRKDVATSTPEVEHRCSEDFKTILKKPVNKGTCNEQSCHTQERENNGSKAQEGPLVDETTNHENPSVDVVTDGKTRGSDFSEKEQEGLLHVLENHSEAEKKEKGNRIQEGDLKPCQDEEEERTEQEASNTTYLQQRPSSATLPTWRSPSLLLRTHHYIFTTTTQDTIQNLHL